MSPTHDSLERPKAPTTVDGFDVLDACHRQTLFKLGKLTALVSRLISVGVDGEARAMAADILEFFTTTARLHHEDEEQHVFPALLEAGDPDIVQAVLRLQQDHGWLEEDWLELSPHLCAVAADQSWYDLDLLREGVEVFVALSHDHIALEESLIYPQARMRLNSTDRREMGREMAARRRAGAKKQAASGVIGAGSRSS
ncbi:hemerythrin domain-containing protein [Piscinibacter sp.]|uniref:hemerythrin domain-containing protein n=1 Tax=Piscinibacter sp. TaxID=1903157 RepID=UPI002B6C9F80|nr:hemerythrin domain-containing protein [Albitalea sp.]HUG22095.1 hemerythrin domain-containing protein [Albitalea sp.]